ncbi:M16 family metallopeptidase [Fulvivirga lutea]|uniref:Insulinase family protein n=1 Tax=Fulvivirga lutea TaxID=2810512 RepID=A0A974WKP6_9BACT|nr:pitrilysin family protein [Fulvivirga lutea]QSE97940.1 insulinase family protein [Fulvivirga lutea]
MLNRKIAPVTFQPTQIVFPKPETIELSNGLKVHTFYNSNIDAIKVEFIFRNASSYLEPIIGLNLLTSKLLLSGTAKKSAKDIAEEFARLGSFIEVNPSFDYTTVDIHCIKKNLISTLSLFTEILQEANFPEDELTLQRSILISSYNIQQRKNNIVASKLFRSCVFGNHPYGQSATPDYLNKINREAVIKFYRSNWAAFEVFLSGNISNDEIKYLENQFKCNPKSINYTQSFIYSKKIEHVNRSESFQTSIKLGIPTITKSDPNYPTLLFTNYLLGGYFGSRLMKNIREEKGLTYGIYSSIVNLQHASYFTIGSEVSSSKKELAIDEILKEIDSMSLELIPIDEFTIAKNHWMGSLQNELSSPHSLIEKFKSYYLFNLESNYLQFLYDSIAEITQERILEMSKTYLKQDQMTIVSVGG